MFPSGEVYSGQKGYFELFIEKKTHKEGLIIFNVINVAFEIWPQN